MAAPMKGQVCVVTGASRGIGRGIALQLCQAGATVYITGRHMDTLRATAEEAQSRGGQCVPVVCDSSQESEVQSLFEQVDREQQGRLDVLVNNAYAGVPAIMKNINKAFWEIPASIWDDINNVGLRGHYLCSVYGARLMVPAGRGLIVVISSIGGLQYLFSVPYGVGKAACDRLAVDCAQELRRHGVSYVSLWPGLVQTELMKEVVVKKDNTDDPLLKQLRSHFSSAETTEMSGKCVVALATDPKRPRDWLTGSAARSQRSENLPRNTNNSGHLSLSQWCPVPLGPNLVTLRHFCAFSAVFVPTDPNVLSLSGKVLPSCDLARRYSLQDVDGRPVQDYLALSSVLSHGSSLGWLASYLPGFLRMPKWIMTLYASKF
ncbi:dehydrogenase/reductase SDR family member 1 isoform X1 [Mirounga leonina]|nr:dehydrogenase/reductase SDR family member 1 isoform X1 [Mirounga leonina]XP_034849603.1 dehydrogenase/reductase SDR family member 1 isoform X1 [Mirounga leonina]